MANAVLVKQPVISGLGADPRENAAPGEAY